MLKSPFAPHIGFAATHRSVLATEQPHPEEWAALGRRAVAGRRDAFALGRIAARRAMAHLLTSPPPVLPGRDRAPCWPEGIVGAITHAGEWGVAAAAHCPRTRAIGLDLAWLPDLREVNIAETIADADERRWIDGDARRLLALFSAKESVFKALYPSYGEFFGFENVTVQWTEDPAPGFSVRLLRPLGPLATTGDRLWVGVRWTGDFVLSWLSL